MTAGHWVEDGQTSTAQDRKLLPNQSQPPAAVLAALTFLWVPESRNPVTRGHCPILLIHKICEA